MNHKVIHVCLDYKKTFLSIAKQKKTNEKKKWKKFSSYLRILSCFLINQFKIKNLESQTKWAVMLLYMYLDEFRFVFVGVFFYFILFWWTCASITTILGRIFSKTSIFVFPPFSLSQITNKQKKMRTWSEVNPFKMKTRLARICALAGCKLQPSNGFLHQKHGQILSFHVGTKMKIGVEIINSFII